MSRYRLIPAPAQEAVLRDHCDHARYVWNLSVEQYSHWHPSRANAPGYLEQSADPRASTPRAAAWFPSFRADGCRSVCTSRSLLGWRFVGTHPTLDRAGALHIPNLDGLRNLDGLPAAGIRVRSGAPGLAIRGIWRVPPPEKL